MKRFLRFCDMRETYCRQAMIADTVLGYLWRCHLSAIGQQNLPIRNVRARFYDMAGGRDEFAIG
jgi:hypothetical protein